MSVRSHIELMRRLSPVIGMLSMTGICQSLVAQQATVTVMQERKLPGSAKVPTVVEAATRLLRTTTACGTARVCTASWDLRLVALRLDDSTAGPAGVFVARFMVENRGRVASEASETRLCVAAGAQCVGDPVEVPIGALQSGERMDVVQTVRSYQGRDVAPPYSLLVQIDPDRATVESNRANNDGLVRVVVDTPSVAVSSFDVPTSLQSDASQVPVVLVLRNASRVAASAPTQLQLGGLCLHSGVSKPWGDEATRLRVPALGPDESWSATISVRHPLALVKNNVAEATRCTLTADFVSTQGVGGRGRTRELQRPYQIQAKQ